MKKRHTMDIILTLLGITTLAFIVTMIVIFCRIGSVPDTLIVSYFGAAFGEVSVMGWIKNVKEKHGGHKDDNN